MAAMYQVNPLPPARDLLPTMYDLPSEDAGEPGLPDEFHAFQPQLLRETFQSPVYAAESAFIGTDLNLYYEPRQTLWYKRPDWFVALGVRRALQQAALRLSYVIWQEGVSPFLVVELLSPGTEAEDLGQTLREVNQPPTKWEVYEQILRVPYYVVFDRYTTHLRVFRLMPARYQEQELAEPRVWFDDIQLGLGVWQGCYQGAEGQWLRWYDAGGNWIPTEAERAEQEQRQANQERQRTEQERQRAEQAQQQAERERQRANQADQRAEQERQRADRLAERLRQLGVDPEKL